MVGVVEVAKLVAELKAAPLEVVHCTLAQPVNQQLPS